MFLIHYLSSFHLALREKFYVHCTPRTCLSRGFLKNRENFSLPRNIRYIKPTGLPSPCFHYHHQHRQIRCLSQRVQFAFHTSRTQSIIPHATGKIRVMDFIHPISRLPLLWKNPNQSTHFSFQKRESSFHTSRT